MLRVLRRTFAAKAYENILHSTEGKVAVLQLNRPKQLNALSSGLIADLNDCLATYERDSNIGAIVLTGNERAFAAGADIKEMASKDYSTVYQTRMLETWNFISSIKKPIIAAVSGHALGGGFEMALMCDVIYASKTAKFGLPEVTLGTIPGAGGTQRLIREIGKSRAMEMILSAEIINAEEAFRLGLVSKIIDGDVVAEAKKTAEKIAKFSPISLSLAKEAVNSAYDLGLHQGLEYEKKLFWSTFATEDRKEGMSAFVEKRQANFKGK